MDVHKNARSVPASRALLFRRVSAHGWSVRAASEAVGISDRRGREWIRRAVAGEPFTDRSSRPHTTRSTDAKTRVRIVKLRRQWLTLRQIAQLVGVSTSTAARICRAAGLSRLKQLDAPPPPFRYERERPGELLHVSVGVTVERVMTDNGSAYVSDRFRDTCRQANVRHKRIRPHTPQTNGKVERLIQTMLREWAYRFRYRSSDERQSWLAPYLHFYNVHRAHSALSYNAPASRLTRNNVLRRNS